MLFRSTGSIEIVPARGQEQLVVRDNGIGLTGDDMQRLLSIIGSSSKRGGLARTDFLGQFGIGLLSCFLVADSIEVVSRSAREPDAPTVRWVGLSDGTFTIGDALRPLPAPGTEVRLKPRHGSHRWCDTDACLQFARDAGYRKVTLWTHSVLTAARRIYEQAGFKLVATDKHNEFGQELVGETWDLDL